MNKKWFYRGILLIAFITLIMAGVALADTLDYTLDWWTVDGGGGISTGGDYELIMTVGQPDANVLSGSDFTLAGGFLPGGETVVTYQYIHLPILVR